MNKSESLFGMGETNTSGSRSGGQLSIHSRSQLQICATYYGNVMNWAVAAWIRKTNTIVLLKLVILYLFKLQKTFSALTFYTIKKILKKKTLINILKRHSNNRLISIPSSHLSLYFSFHEIYLLRHLICSIFFMMIQFEN